MTSDLLIRYLHFLGIFVIFAVVLVHHLFLKGEVPRALLIRAHRLDAAYGVASVVVLATGLLQWFSGSKPAVFYTSNPVFHAKVTLFLLIGLASVYPTVFLFKQKRGAPDDLVPVPKGLIHCLRIELLLLVILPLLAVIMAKGIGIPVLKP